MSNCNLTLPFTGSADELCNKIKSQVEDNGGTFSGDASAGTFSVPALSSSIKGSYSIDGQNLMIHIDKKPVIISCGQIENYVKSHI